jgi:hypothetical protein
VVDELLAEGVLLANGRIRPALGPVELGDHRDVILDADLIDPVLVAIEREQVAVGAVTQRVHAVEDHVRFERGERVGRISCHRLDTAVDRETRSDKRIS